MKLRYVMTLLGAGLASVATAPVLANVVHQADTEIGYYSHTEDFEQGKTTAQVKQELLAEKSDKREWYFKNLNLARPAWSIKSTKTRDQVVQEMASVTPEEQARLDEIYTPGS